MKKLFILVVFVPMLVSCRAGRNRELTGEIVAVEDALWKVIPREAEVEHIGVGFGFTEGPAWHPDGFLVFSDIPANLIYRRIGKGFAPYRQPSGKSNGLLALKDGSLLCCEHASRSIVRYYPDGRLDTLVSRFRGSRLNSPNDLCRDARGALFFTDPPWGLDGGHEDPSKELPFAGVYRYYQGRLSLLDSTLSWPNGIALSPDNKQLYVANYRYGNPRNTAGGQAEWLQYSLDPAGRVKDRRILFKIAAPAVPGGPDGMAVDRNGNLFVTSDEGVYILDKTGRHLGSILLPDIPSNVCFGPRQKSLFITARTNLYRIEL